MQTKTQSELFEIGAGEGPEDKLAIKELTHRVQKAFNSLEITVVPGPKGEPTIEFWVFGSRYGEGTMRRAGIDNLEEVKLAGMISTLVGRG